MSEVSFKVVLQHNQRNQTKHRFRGDFSYEQVCTLLSYLWGGKKNLVIEYTDEDGDDILVLTDVEWRECVRLHAERQEREGKTLPLTLRVKKARVPPKNSKRAAAKAATSDATHVDPETADKRRPEGDSSSDSEGLEYVSANGSLVGQVDASMLHDSRCSVRTSDSAAPSVPSTKQKERVEATPALVPPLHLSAIRRTNNNNGAAGSMVETTTMADAASLTLLNKLLGVDIVELLARGHPLPFHPAFILQRTTDDESGDVHLDLDLPELRKSVITGGNMMMDSRQFTAARVLLEAAIAVFPDDSVIEYNLACASSLEGNADGALHWLEQALSHGYQDTTLLLIDEDLQVARASSKFMPLIERYFPGIAEAQQPQQAPAANNTASDSVKAADETPAVAPEIPAAPLAAPVVVSPAVPVVTVLPPPETPRTNTLLGIFPTMNPAEAHRLLELAKGNLNLAVQWKLGSV